MPLVQAVLLALIQGLTEFLPVSSSAHLALTPWLLGWKDQGLEFDIALHIGTLLAVLLYFFRDWLQILANGFGLKYSHDPVLDENPRLLWYLAAASVPLGVAGLALKDLAETTLRSPYIMGTMLIVVALLMAAAERMARHERSIGQMTLRDCLLVGVAQALALVPGTSRSGITITAGLALRLERATAARFSFLLSTPAVAAAAAKGVLDLRKHGALESEMAMPLAVGIAVSAVTGCAVIALLLRYLRSNSVMPFVVYRVIFGIMIIALAMARS